MDKFSLLGGTLAGSGTATANVTNAGLVAPGGTEASSILAILGSYTQTAEGTLNIKISGVNAKTDFDQLVVSGLATLDGTLNISLTNGFRPNLGDSFRILTFGSRSGDFAAENGLDLGGGLRLDPRFDAGSLTLVATGGNTPPPGGGQPVAEADEAILRSVPDGPGAKAFWQSVAVTHQRTTACESLDTFFQLLTENERIGGVAPSRGIP